MSSLPVSSVELSYTLISGPDPLETSYPVVFIGSLGSNNSMWVKQHEALAKHFEAAYVDARGHGASPVPAGPYTVEEMAGDVVALLDRLGWEKAHVVGLSLGGAIAQTLAAKASDRIVSLAAVATATKFGTPEAWHDKAALVREKGTQEIALDSATRWFTPEYGESSGMKQHYFEMVSACTDEGYAASCEALAGYDSAEFLHQVSCPTLVVAGDQDAGCSPETMRKIVDLVPTARPLKVVSPASHLLNVEQAASFNEILLDHLLAADKAASS